MQLKRNKEMELETLKKSYKKQIIIGALAVCVIGVTLTLNLTKAKYRVDGSVDLAKGTINYKAYDFKIMAMYKSEDGANYTEITDRIPSSGYVINEEKSYCTIDNKNKDTNVVLKTVSGNHVFNNLAKSDKCYLYFDKKTSVDNASELLAKVQSEAKTTTPDFSQVATTDEGVYAVSDGMYGGTSYYWRGAATTNYVKFANFCWRIMRINGDKTIRLIYDGATCHANGTSTTDSIAVANIAYNLDYKQSNYVGWTYEGTLQRPSSNASATASNAKTQLESWYSSNITGTNASKVASSKFCNDRNTASGSTWSISPDRGFYYAPYKRIYIDYVPVLSCPDGDVYILNVGLITADEVMYAGGNNNNNTSYYLYTGQGYWTMSPTEWYEDGGWASIFAIVKGGGLGTSIYAGYTSLGLRPVINLRSDVTFSGGDGTQNNPYVVQ